jgi:hypothetical protein
MEIINDWPPNIKKIRKYVSPTNKTIFTYGDTIYNPGGGKIDLALMAHEETHSKQQADVGVDDWWERYLSDNSFRLRQEVQAYKVQIKKSGGNRTLIQKCAHDLSSPIYGEIISYATAYKLLLGL